jgi:hypothetical protein
MNEMFIPLRKVDATERLVYGRIDETPDRAGEIFDYASSKPEFVKWSSDQFSASHGKSFGNVRAMHSRIAAGKLNKIDFDDTAKAIQLVAHITDDDEWQKVQDGLYTGFSPGGRYLNKWPEGDKTRYTAQPYEVSLVDLPCIPSATFSMVKTDGVEEKRPFALGKAGARNSAADLAMIQHMHDTSVALGACCPGPDMDLNLNGGSGKAVAGGNLVKMIRDIETIRAELANLSDERDRLQKRIAHLEAQPRPGGAALRSIEKGHDFIPAGDLEEEELARIQAMPNGIGKSLALIKIAHRHPVAVRY